MEPRNLESSALVDVVRWHVVLRALYDPQLPGRGFVLSQGGRRVIRAGVGSALAGFGDSRAVSLSWDSVLGFPSAWGYVERVYREIRAGNFEDAVVEELRREAIAQARIVEEFSDDKWAGMLRAALRYRTDYRGTGVSGAEELIERAVAHKNRQVADFEEFWENLREQKRPYALYRLGGWATVAASVLAVVPVLALWLVPVPFWWNDTAIAFMAYSTAAAVAAGWVVGFGSVLVTLGKAAAASGAARVTPTRLGSFRARWMLTSVVVAVAAATASLVVYVAETQFWLPFAFDYLGRGLLDPGRRWHRRRCGWVELAARGPAGGW